MQAPSQKLPSQRLLSRRQRGFVGLNASRPPAPVRKDVASPFVCRQSTLARLFLCSYEKGQGQSSFFFLREEKRKGMKWLGFNTCKGGSKKKKKRETKGRRRFTRDGNGHTEGLAGSGNSLKINRSFFSIFERPGGSMTKQET